MPGQANNVQPGDKSQDQPMKFKVKVDGQERELELTNEQIIERLQKAEDYTQKTQALAEKEKTLKASEEEIKEVKLIVDEMKDNPKLADTLNKVYSDFKSGKISKSYTTKDRDLKKLDKLIEEATDSETKEQLREMREIIQEEAPISILKQEIDALKQEISGLKSLTQTGQSEKIKTDLQKLEERFGKDLVKKYQKNIMTMALKYPHQSVIKLFYYYADDAEIKTALLEEAKKEEKRELERKKKGASPGAEPSNVAKSELVRDKAGKVTMDSIRQRVKERLGIV